MNLSQVSPSESTALAAWAPPARSDRLQVGRDAEMQSLLSVLLGLDEETAPGALLIGESGMGKTHVLRLLDDCVPGLLHGQARLGDKLSPYSTLTRWLQQWMDRLPQAQAKTMASMLVALQPHAAPHGADSGSSGPPDVAQVHELMLRASPHVTAWTLDDLQLADDASMEWLLRFIQQSSVRNRPGQAV
jgi:AAA ATPase domain